MRRVCAASNFGSRFGSSSGEPMRNSNGPRTSVNVWPWELTSQDRPPLATVRSPGWPAQPRKPVPSYSSVSLSFVP